MMIPKNGCNVFSILGIDIFRKEDFLKCNLNFNIVVDYVFMAELNLQLFFERVSKYDDFAKYQIFFFHKSELRRLYESAFSKK